MPFQLFFGPIGHIGQTNHFIAAADELEIFIGSWQQYIFQILDFFGQEAVQTLRGRNLVKEKVQIGPPQVAVHQNDLVPQKGQTNPHICGESRFSSPPFSSSYRPDDLVWNLAVQNNNSAELTQLVVTIPELNSISLQADLEMDFNKMGGVQFCETSLLTQTMVLKYNSRKIALTEIENVFRKWECNPSEYSYQKLY